MAISWIGVLSLLIYHSFLVLVVTGQHNRVVLFHNEVKRQMKQGLVCEGMNGTTILMTASTGSTFELINRQRRGIKLMQAVEDNECLLKKLITVCLDLECEHRCIGNNAGHCTRFANVGPSGLDRDAEVLPMDFKNGNHGDENWRKLTALKWMLIDTAFRFGAETVAYMDADVLLLKNPFKDLLKQHNYSYPLLHLTDTGKTPSPSSSSSGNGCDASPHTGFMLFSIVGMRNYKYRVFQLAAHMISQDHTKQIHDGKQDERAVFKEVLDESGVQHCALPFRTYTGACHHAHDDNSTIDDLVIYHASCDAETTTIRKMVLMDHMLEHKANPTKKDAPGSNPFDPKGIGV